MTEWSFVVETFSFCFYELLAFKKCIEEITKSQKTLSLTKEAFERDFKLELLGLSLKRSYSDEKFKDKRYPSSVLQIGVSNYSRNYKELFLFEKSE